MIFKKNTAYKTARTIINSKTEILQKGKEQNAVSEILNSVLIISLFYTRNYYKQLKGVEIEYEDIEKGINEVLYYQSLLIIGHKDFYEQFISFSNKDGKEIISSFYDKVNELYKKNNWKFASRPEIPKTQNPTSEDVVNYVIERILLATRQEIDNKYEPFIIKNISKALRLCSAGTSGLLQHHSKQNPELSIDSML